ncbi:GumC family protein [Saccharicrinis sp. 156]|uniref:GumC family protein n=1 Tax=Saccharicrinis sp. 156 TaxID=3417574 RepID=UPI003D342655
MKYKNKEIKGNQERVFFREVGIDPSIIVKLILKNWYVFLITIPLAVVGAHFYISIILPVYQVSTSVLIDEVDDRGSGNNEELLQGLGLSGGMRNLDNQIKILTSRELTARVLKSLDFEIEYYYISKGNNVPFNKDIPAKLVYKGTNPLARNLEYVITYLGDNQYSLVSEQNQYNFQASFGQDVEFAEGSIKLECNNKEWFESNKDVNFGFTIHSSERLVRNFNRRLEVGILSNSGTILNISLKSTNRQRDVDFLNRLTEVFQALSLEKKNLEANRRIQFIDDQLVGISDSLVITEKQLQQFRSLNRVMDLSAQGQVIIDQLTNLENEKARLNLEANYYDYLADYLERNISGELPLPISMGITDDALTGLVTELADLQEELSGTGGGEKNPLQNLLGQRVNSKKQELMETLNGLRRANNLAQTENQSRIARVNSQASALPETERQLLGIERKFKLNDELYTFLLEKRSELQMQKASNRPGNEVVDPASVLYSEIVAPNPNLILFMALLLGSVVPFLIIFLRYLLNNRIREEDLEVYGDIPIVGNIPKIKSNPLREVLDNRDSAVAEAYRLMRSKLQFITKDTHNPVILITSSMPGEGKTVSSVNLASVYSLLNKKTVLVGFDLRNPKFNEELNLNNNKGVSTFLIGKDKLDDIIQETAYENLSVISSGPIPPNPAELAASDAAKKLFESLKTKFEYIVVDTAPLGLISDTHHLTPYADATLLIVRIKYTLKDTMYGVLSEFGAKHLNKLALVLNDVVLNGQKYGYGKRYGYLKK